MLWNVWEECSCEMTTKPHGAARMTTKLFGAVKPAVSRHRQEGSSSICFWMESGRPCDRGELVVM